MPQEANDDKMEIFGGWNDEAHGEPQAIDESGNHKAHLDMGGTVRR